MNSTINITIGFTDNDNLSGGITCATSVDTPDGVGTYTDIIPNGSIDYQISLTGFSGIEEPKFVYIEFDQPLDIVAGLIATPKTSFGVNLLKGVKPIGIYTGSITGVTTIFIDNPGATDANIKVFVS